MKTRIEIERVRRGLSQKALAALIGTYQPKICQYETRQRAPRFKNRQRICDFFHLGIADLFEIGGLARMYEHGKE
jgi:transcriptional regulator with XRE-family HTH domain